MTAWLFGIGSALLLASSVVAPARSPQARPSERRLAWLKGIAALRAFLLALLAVLAFSAVHDAVAAASDAARWTLTLAAGGCTLAVLLNTAAGLWLLSPRVGADLGLDVIASSSSGTIRGYGWARLEVMTRDGWTAHLPYAAIALRPFSVHRHDAPRVVELRLRHDRWHDDDLRYLRQLAVLSPFRDASLPVSVSHRACVATVRLGLAQRASEAGVQRQLERALSRHWARASAPPGERRRATAETKSRVAGP